MKRTLLLVAAVLGTAAAVSASPSATPNLVANGSFERSLSGWTTFHSRLARVRGVAGKRAARVRAKDPGQDFAIVPARRPVARTRTGQVYVAQGWVRSSRAREVCLRIREWSGTRQAGEANQCVASTGRWQRFPTVRYSAVGGRPLDVYAYARQAVRNESFDVDGLTLRRGAATPPPPATPPTIVAAGDIARCDSAGDESTAALVAQIPGTVAAIGDVVYENGTAAEFTSCYDRSWGQFKSRTRPAAGNHEYHSPGAGPYYAYFGAAAGPAGRGYYSYDLGGWHVVVLNTNCASVGGCQAGSAQEQWLRADLAANRRACTLAYGHHPRFSSRFAETQLQPLWQALYDNDVDVVLAAHQHNYERFAPQNAAGASDPARGIRQFVVGTGGAELHRFTRSSANSEVRNDHTLGVLRLDLRANGYDWRFLPVAGGTFTDAGSGACH